MRVLIVSEGKHEIGDESGVGVLEQLVRRLLPERDLEFHCDKWSNPDIHALNGKGQGLFKRAARWMLEANRRGYDAVVLVTDEDGFHQRRSELDQAQHWKDAPLPHACGLAIRSIDAWLLADDVALSRALGRTIERQKDPERIREPRPLLRQLCISTGIEEDPARTYVKVASTCDLSVLENRCPKGFRPFAARVRGLM